MPWRDSSADPLEEHGDSLAEADAHRGQSEAAPAVAEVADKKPLKLPSQPYYRNTLIETGDDKVMLFDQNNGKMQEYDLKAGKATEGGAKWTSVSSPMSIQRLPNGNILLADSGYRKLTERAPDGTEVWSMTNVDNSGNTQLVRAFVR